MKISFFPFSSFRLVLSAHAIQTVGHVLQNDQKQEHKKSWARLIIQTRTLWGKVRGFYIASWLVEFVALSPMKV